MTFHNIRLGAHPEKKLLSLQSIHSKGEITLHLLLVSSTRYYSNNLYSLMKLTIEISKSACLKRSRHTLNASLIVVVFVILTEQILADLSARSFSTT